MNDTIGFSNFRRFADFPEINLGDITILVGGNNSGKSTIVKALLLCADNLLSMRMNERNYGEGDSPLVFKKPQFHFDANEFHDVKIKEFARAIHNKPIETVDLFLDTKKKVLPTAMTFKFAIGQFHFTFVVSGNRDEHSTTGNVECIIIEDRNAQVRYVNDYCRHEMEYHVLNADFDEQKNLIRKLIEDFKKAKETYEKANEDGDFEKTVHVAATIDKIRSQICAILEKEDEDLEDDVMLQMLKRTVAKNYKPIKARYIMPLGIAFDEISEHVVLNVISNFHNFATTKGVTPKFKSGEDQNDFEGKMQEYVLFENHRKAMMLDEKIFIKSRRDLKNLLSSIKIEYISAHAVNQNALYNTADKNDYIAQTVHNFWREKIVPGDMEHSFILDWMQKLGVGIDFKIIPLVPGEAYTVSITENSGSIVSLADKGMGSIQTMVLLFRLATILRKYESMGKKYNSIPPTIIIEEPEQNLHPKIQSMLADLFHYLATYNDLKFIVETHSEYIVRKSQVLVSEEDFKDEEDLRKNNKFKVYYFPSEGEKPYEMQYRIDGCFANDFGEGFFDEAENLAFKIL